MAADSEGNACDKQTIGLLQRRHVHIDPIRYIGKESNHLEAVDAGLIHSEQSVYTEYVCSRIRELPETLSAGTIALEISSRNARVQMLQNRWDRMRRVIDERAASPAFADVPGGTTGLLVKDYKGKDADQPVYKVDTRLLAELRAHEKQAAEELGQWSEKRELTGDALQNEITISHPTG